MPETPTDVTDAAAGTPAETPQVDADEPESFSREYVSELRQEAAERRTAAKEATEKADGLARQLFRAKVAATGKLADPDDLPYDAALLDDAEALNTAIGQILTTKPHFASRRPAPGSSIGQGQQGSPVAPPTSLIDAIRAQQRR